VQLLLGGAVVGTATADAAGSYQVTPSAAQTAGAKAYRVRGSNPAYIPEHDPNNPAYDPNLPVDPAYDVNTPATLESGTLNMQIDTAAPVSTIGTPRPSNGTVDNTPTFSFSAAEPNTTFECQLLRGAEIASDFEPCTSPLTYDEQPTNHRYTFNVRGTDPAGNLGAAATYSWNIGTVVAAPGAPGIGTVTAGDRQATVNWTAPTTGGAVASYTVNAYANNGATVSASVESGATARSVSVPGLTNGTPYTFMVVANNSGGSTASPRSTSVTPQAAVVDSTAPTVTRRTPAANATSIGAASNVTATFSENVTNVTGTTVVLRNPAGATMAAAVSYNATTRVATLNPNANLANDTRYTVTLTSGIRDAARNALVQDTWSFVTGPAPRATTVAPAANATGVRRGANVTATFSEAVKSVSGTTMTLTNVATGAVVPAVVSYNATTRVATLNPNANLSASTSYRVNLTGGATAIRDNANNPLVNRTWTFRTGTTI
jgi:hypothetical protein